MNVYGHAAIVTGGASGLGAATVRALAARGARVAVLDRNSEGAEAVAAETGGLAAACDVTDEAAVLAALARSRHAHGPLRIVIHCAGIGTAGRIVGRDGPMRQQAFERTVRVNLFGTFNVMRLSAHEMSQTELVGEERGVFVATASVAAYEGQLGQAAYAAAKGGIVALVLPAAREFARFGIRVMAIAPGFFETPLMNELPPEAVQKLVGEIPFPARLGKPEEFAQLALAIVENPSLNGETIRLDG
ncbi:MAG TPA: SDR family NAD(P)-dependent oxidoreductase, partial [Candidatus Lustribacter sp.]